MGCFSGRLMSAASDQKLFCKLCSPFNCSFDEFVGEKVVSPSYSSAIFLLPPWLSLFGSWEGLERRPGSLSLHRGGPLMRQGPWGARGSRTWSAVRRWLCLGWEFFICKFPNPHILKFFFFFFKRLFEGVLLYISIWEKAMPGPRVWRGCWRGSRARDLCPGSSRSLMCRLHPHSLGDAPLEAEPS